MAHFVAYETEAPLSSPPIKAKGEWVSQPVQTDFAEFLSGSVWSEKEGSLEIQHSFDYPQSRENEKEALEKSHWDAGEKVSVKNGEGKGFYFFAIAPYFRLVWTQGTEETKKLRIFARAQEKGRV